MFLLRMIQFQFNYNKMTFLSIRFNIGRIDVLIYTIMRFNQSRIVFEGVGGLKHKGKNCGKMKK